MRSVTVIVELEKGNQRLCGWLTDPEGRRRRFDGWLEFASRFAEFHDPSGSRVASGEASPL